MDTWRGRVVVLGLLMAVLLLSGEVERSQGAVACATVTQNTLPCLSFVRTAGAKPPARNSPCCSGVRALDSLGSVSVENRRNICSCLQSSAKALNPNPQAVAALPGACGATHSFSLSQNCNTGGQEASGAPYAGRGHQPPAYFRIRT